ncbi:MAG: hypothetical protein K6T91_09765 [Firmicutes bacterium]|nr:hypothetical protein [Bacillota bacterium]
MKSYLKALSIIITAIILTSLTTLIACQKESIGKKSSINESQKFMPNLLDGNGSPMYEKMYLYQPSETTDYFLRAFFSGNFKNAYKMTSSAYRIDHPYEEVEKEWSEFYRQAAKNGINWKSLSYRSDFRGDDGDNGGIVVSPQGRMIMRIYCREINSPLGSFFAVDCILLFKKSLEIKKGNGRERIDLTNKPDDKIYKKIFSMLVDRSLAAKREPHSDVAIKKLILSDGWARAVYDFRGENMTKHIVLRQVDGSWRIISENNSAPNYNEYPESPFMLWAADDWR